MPLTITKTPYNNRHLRYDSHNSFIQCLQTCYWLAWENVNFFVYYFPKIRQNYEKEERPTYGE